jgi:hypothetical protein
MRKRLRFTATVLLFAAMSGCVRQVRNNEGPQPGGAGLPIDWSNPYPQASNVPDIESALSRIRFVPAVAPSLGSPAKILLTEGAELGEENLVLVYRDPSYGRYLVEESISQTDQDGLESSLKCDPSQGCQGSSFIVTLSDGRRAVVLTGEGSNGILWLAHGGTVLMDVYGPPDTFTAAAATAIANQLEAAG